MLGDSQIQELIEKAVNEAIEPVWKAFERLEGDRAELARRVRELEERRLANSNGADHERASRIKNLVDDKKTITFYELRGRLGIGKVLLNRSVRIMMDENPGEYAIRMNNTDKRTRSLVKLQVIK